jgi:aryl-alcohol dehydrogenase-like predicted oxidoreductase
MSKAAPQTISLGNTGIELSPMGLGCMSMSDFYDRPENRDETESVATIVEALDKGVQLIDTADVYGNGHNEMLVGRAFRQWRAAGGNRDRAILATKFGNVRDEAGNWLGRSGKPEYVQFACERSLKFLDGETIDLYYLHRVADDTPIEETVGAMARLVEQGKVRFLGLSEASVDTLRRACAVHPISALQTEYSLWYREPEQEHFAACAELGVTFVPYSPLGRGFLTGRITKPEDFPEGDSRPSASRFQGENFEHNLALAQGLQAIAARKGCTPAQLALAWIMAQGRGGAARSDPWEGIDFPWPYIIPIPGCKRRSHLSDNLGALQLELSAEELAELDALAPVGFAKGQRYGELAMKSLNL